jgi:hypothetical protein
MTDRRKALRAHRVTVAAAILTLLGTGLMLFSWRDFPAHPIRDLQIAAIVLSVASLVVLFIQRQAPSKRVALGAFLVVLAPVCAFFWFNDSIRATQQACWVPFEGNKVTMLLIGLVAPPSLSVGLVAIGAFAASGLVHFAVMPDVVRSSMVRGEPWTLLAYIGMAIGTLVFRLRSIDLEDKVREAQAEAAILHEVARLSLAVRDLANTPVQTLEVLGHLLLRPEIDLQVVQGRLHRAVARLKELGHLLSKYDVATTAHATSSSLDSLAIVTEKVGGTARTRPP